MDFHFFSANHPPAPFGFYAPHRCQSTGHPITRIGNAAELLAKFFGLRMKVRGGRYERKQKVKGTVGLADKEDFDRLIEEIDRLQGMLRELKRKQKQDKD